MPVGPDLRSAHTDSAGAYRLGAVHTDLALVHTNSAVVLTDSALVLTDSALVILINLFSPLRRDGTMRCLAVLVVGLSVPSCTPSPPGSSWTVGKSTQRIMSADGDWVCHYY